MNDDYTRKEAEVIAKLDGKSATVFIIACEVIDSGGALKTQTTYDLRRGLDGTTWDVLGGKCFSACKNIVEGHFNKEDRDRDTA